MNLVQAQLDVNRAKDGDSECLRCVSLLNPCSTVRSPAKKMAAALTSMVGLEPILAMLLFCRLHPVLVGCPVYQH